MQMTPINMIIVIKIQASNQGLDKMLSTLKTNKTMKLKFQIIKNPTDSENQFWDH